MILVMFLVALALGSAQLVLPSPDFAGLYHLGGESVVILGAIVVTNLVMTVPCIWGALVKSNPVPLLAWPVYCAFVTAIEFTALCFLLGPPGADSREVFMAFLLFNVLQCANSLLRAASVSGGGLSACSCGADVTELHRCHSGLTEHFQCLTSRFS